MVVFRPGPAEQQMMGNDLMARDRIDQIVQQAFLGAGFYAARPEIRQVLTAFGGHRRSDRRGAALVGGWGGGRAVHPPPHGGVEPVRPRRLVADVAHPLRARRNRGCLRRAHLGTAEQRLQEVFEAPENTASRGSGLSCRPIMPLGHSISFGCLLNSSCTNG